MSITVISGTTPETTGQLKTQATTNLVLLLYHQAILAHMLPLH